ncbi:MAG: hypothetical protein QXG30_05505 [Candidatus Korarchaeum sp.]
MEGLSPSPRLFEELTAKLFEGPMARSGFTLTGEEASGLEAGESQGLNGYTYPYLAQNPVPRDPSSAAGVLGTLCSLKPTC